MDIGMSNGFQENFVSKWAKKLIGGILVFIILICIYGCKHTKLTLRSYPDTNKGQPVYVMIRSVNAKKFLTDSYQDIADKVFADPPDPSVLDYKAILPGQKQKIKLKKPDTSVGIYCMFTEPGDEWKIILPRPLNSKYKIELEKNRIIEK